jgi:hypothetical protein
MNCLPVYGKRSISGEAEVSQVISGLLIVWGGQERLLWVDSGSPALVQSGECSALKTSRSDLIKSDAVGQIKFRLMPLILQPAHKSASRFASIPLLRTVCAHI